MKHTEQKRKFLGKTEGFTDKKEKLFFTKMLKAYLKGHEVFFYGKSWQPNPVTGFMDYLPTPYLVHYEKIN